MRCGKGVRAALEDAGLVPCYVVYRRAELLDVVHTKRRDDSRGGPADHVCGIILSTVVGLDDGCFHPLANKSVKGYQEQELEVPGQCICVSFVLLY